MIRIALCEDQMIQRAVLKDMLLDYKNKKHLSCVIDAYPDGKDLMEAYRKGKRYHIYLLDVMMPAVNGIDTAHFLREKGDDAHIIFLTAERDYAVESYQVHAFYYLLKPADSTTLYPLLDQCIARIRSEGDDVITVKDNDGMHSIAVSEINYVCISERRARYHLTDGSEVETVTLRVPFKTLVKELTELKQFVMCGASLLVNAGHVKEISWDETVHFANGEKICLPHSAVDVLKKALTR